MSLLDRLFRREPQTPPTRPWSMEAGRRVYAVGDIHGRLDLLDELLARIAADEAGRGEADTIIVFLGDYIDRGPASRGVIDRLRALEQERGPGRTIFLMGNHEEVLLRTAEGDRRAASLLHRIGGRETLLSYGVDEQTYELADAEALVELVQAHVPREHLDWIAAGLPQFQLGDYLFVHAGIRPDVALEEQVEADLRWIREEFLRSDKRHPAMIVHGHSITDEVDRRPNRIGLDTGAFKSGVLSAVGLEGFRTWFLQAGTPAGEAPAD